MARIGDELDSETANCINYGTKCKLFVCTGPSNDPLEHLLVDSSSKIISNFRTKTLKSYKKEEFESMIPKELRPFIDRIGVMKEGNEGRYHKERISYLRRLSKYIEKEPRMLKAYEQFLVEFVYNKIFLGDLQESSNSNAKLQAKQLETNISDLYAMLSTKNLDFKRYITGIDQEGKTYSKSMPNLKFEDIPQFYRVFHSHAPVLLSVEPEPFQGIIPEKASWTNNVEIPPKDKQTKYAKIKDVSQKSKYFSTRFSDGTISIGVTNTSLDNGLCATLQSDTFSDFFLNDSMPNKKDLIKVDLYA